MFDLDFISRLLVALSYGAVVYFGVKWRETIFPPESRALLYTLLGAVSAWTVFYLYLTFFDPAPTQFIGMMTRVMHIPLAMSIALIFAYRQGRFGNGR